ncbi:hypothetical protein CRM22_004013, partial [Opisthorchis felineus]
AIQRRKEYHDKTIHRTPPGAVDRALVRVANLTPSAPTELYNKWNGPFVVAMYPWSQYREDDDGGLLQSVRTHQSRPS